MRRRQLLVSATAGLMAPGAAMAQAQPGGGGGSATVECREMRLSPSGQFDWVFDGGRSSDGPPGTYSVSYSCGVPVEVDGWPNEPNARVMQAAIAGIGTFELTMPRLLVQCRVGQGLRRLEFWLPSIFLRRDASGAEVRAAARPLFVWDVVFQSANGGIVHIPGVGHANSLAFAPGDTSSARYSEIFGRQTDVHFLIAFAGTATILMEGVLRTAVVFPDLPAAEMHALDYKARMEAAQAKCGTGCVMTTASVQMLGRADDCFELSMMRRLRAHFAEETGVIADHVAASQRILARDPAGLRPALFLFWLLVSVPTAALVALRLWAPARAWYLAGFGLLKRALLRGQSRIAAGGHCRAKLLSFAGMMICRSE